MTHSPLFLLEDFNLKRSLKIEQKNTETKVLVFGRSVLCFFQRKLLSGWVAIAGVMLHLRTFESNTKRKNRRKTKTIFKKSWRKKNILICVVLKKKNFFKKMSKNQLPLQCHGRWSNRVLSKKYNFIVSAKFLSKFIYIWDCYNSSEMCKSFFLIMKILRNYLLAEKWKVYREVALLASLTVILTK